MSNTYIRLIKEELQASKCTPVQKIRLDEVNELIRRSLFKLPLLNPESRELFIEMINKMALDTEYLSRLRITKVALGSPLPADTIDEGVLKAVENIIKLEKELLYPLPVRHRDKTLVLFIKDCEVSGEKYRRNDVALLSFNELLVAMIQECVKPLRHILMVSEEEKSS
ncbi:hypothetical protein [Desulfurococcus amylolyticus]|uniref:hypothetical protein n=1 Tax=Desulfurococcus TaxID=2273 RepID=UPI0023F2F3B1|nr:hypothetical protein [Desulfurococcus amylolyticus]